FVGTTALGTREVVATPLDTLFAGVEVQATIADNLLAQDFIHRSMHGRTLDGVVVLVVGVAIAVLASQLGIAAGLAAAFAAVAALHAMGKVGVPDGVINKPGALTADELAEMRKHPTLGHVVILKAEAQLAVRDAATLEMAKAIVYTHHERWDGAGYPQGLRG